MIKKALITLTALATLAGGFITAQAANITPGTFTAAEKNIYPKTFIVAEIDRDEDIIFLLDGNGFVFEYSGVEDWHAGDLAAATMDDNGTPEIFDDKIDRLTFQGWNIYTDFWYDDCLYR